MVSHCESFYKNCIFAAGHDYGTVGIDNNIQLVNMIISAKKETIKNMHQ